MCRTNRFPRFPSAIVFACLALVATADAGAQTCPAPATLTPNAPQWINTCASGTSLGLVCGVFPVYGPAAIVRMPLPYPVGRLIVQSQTPGYEPAMFLLRSQCTNTAPCGYASVDTLDLRLVDSGDYFLAIAPWYPESAACGQIFVTYALTPQEQTLMLDGVLRGGMSVAPPNP